MRYTQLRAFYHVALYGSFSRAADALNLTQPAVSDQVRQLEADYAVDLFDRRKRQIQLTALGETLLPVCNRLFDAEREAGEVLSDARALRSGRLRLALDCAVHLMPAIRSFRQQYAGVRLSMSTANSQQVLEQVRNYDVHIGLLGERPQDADLNVLPLTASPLIAFVPAGHALAAEATISLKALLDWPLVLREPGSKTRQLFEAAVRERGLSVEAAIEVEGRELVTALVESGAGVGIVAAAELPATDRLHALTLSDCRIEMPESLIYLKERAEHRLIQAFVALVEAGE